ncbi:MAG: extracellular solute-binding protein [Enterocloster sp.]
MDEYNAQSDTAFVKVTVLPFADFKKQLSMSAVADSLPDMVFIDNCDCAAYSAMGIFEDITDRVAQFPQFDEYYDQIMATCTYDGKVYALPAESNCLGLYYNVDMAEERQGLNLLPISKS